MSQFPFGVRRLHLIMGLQCNARCIMCYQREFGPRRNMPEAIYSEHLIDLYPHLDSLKIQGGEPTIMANCKGLALLARRHPNLKLTVTTNGIQVSDFWRQTFVEQGGHIQFSLNAATGPTYDRIVRHGDFARAAGNLARLTRDRRGKTPQVSISAVLLKHNALEISALVRLGAETGVDQVIFMVDPWLSFLDLPPRPALAQELEQALELAARHGLKVEGLEAFGRRLGLMPPASEAPARPGACPLPHTNLVVDQAGDVRACCETWRVLGNTYQTPLAQILDGRARRSLQERARAGDYAWCDPYCPDNPAPRRGALLGKYLYLARRDPREFAGKVKDKLRRRRAAQA